MSNPIDQALNDARRERAEGRLQAAEHSYAHAAELARSDGNKGALAHALRHLSDLERGRGDRHEARQHAVEAVALYRGIGEQLGLANALRLQALAADQTDEVAACWREARELYSSLSVGAGVMECDRHLGREAREN